MALPRNKNLLGNARRLRKEMTKEERHLWYDFLRQHPRKFYRQKTIGNYIVDFYCLSAKLVIELDWTVASIMNHPARKRIKRGPKPWNLWDFTFCVFLTWM